LIEDDESRFEKREKRDEDEDDVERIDEGLLLF
jgi:hypothetical protein